MPESLPKPQKKIGSQSGQWGFAIVVAFMLFLIIWILLMIGTFHPFISSMRSSPSSYLFDVNTSTIDPAVSISIDEVSLRTGGKNSRNSYADFVIGMTNNHEYLVYVNGVCTYTDASGRLISTQPFPDNARYHLADVEYSIRVGEKTIHRFTMRVTPEDEPASPLPGIAKNQSSRNIGVLSCSIQNVSARDASG